MARKLKIVFGTITFLSLCVIVVSAHMFDVGSISFWDAIINYILAGMIALVSTIQYRKIDKTLEENQWLKK